ncbi:MAG: AAA family ATPase, partial [Firmicutes bacterium]|nr:AAA family ATPase [Bacillota bacterium]
PETKICAPTIMIWGPPGIGKSSIIKEAAEDNGIPEDNVLDIRLTSLEPVDLRGVPSVVYGRTRFNPPDIFPIGTNEVKEAENQLKVITGESQSENVTKARDEIEQKLIQQYEHILREAQNQKRGVLLFDELPSAQREIQIAAYEIILDRKIGKYTIPDSWVILAAGNRPGEVGTEVASHLPVPLVNRMIHIGVKSKPEDWDTWADEHGLDKSVRSFGISQLAKPNSVLVNPQGYGAGEDPLPNKIPAFLSPRSLDWLDFVNSLVNDGLPAQIVRETIPGAAEKDSAFNDAQRERLADINKIFYRSAIGYTEGTIFNAWKSIIRYMPTGREIYNNPDKAQEYFKILPSLANGNATADDIKKLAELKSEMSGEEYGKVLTQYNEQFEPILKGGSISAPMTTAYFPAMQIEDLAESLISSNTYDKAKFNKAARVVTKSAGTYGLTFLSAMQHKLAKAISVEKENASGVARRAEMSASWRAIIEEASKGGKV